MIPIQHISDITCNAISIADVSNNAVMTKIASTVSQILLICYKFFSQDMSVAVNACLYSLQFMQTNALMFKKMQNKIKNWQSKKGLSYQKNI